MKGGINFVKLKRDSIAPIKNMYQTIYFRHKKSRYYPAPFDNQHFITFLPHFYQPQPPHRAEDLLLMHKD